MPEQTSQPMGAPVQSHTAVPVPTPGAGTAVGQQPAAGAAPPPQTPQSQHTPLPSAQAASTPSVQASPPAKTTPGKSTLKALPTVRDHTTDQLGPSGDEYLPREIDEAGEKKVMPNGQLYGGREYRCRTFLVPGRGDKLFMLATECARVLGYRDSYLLFNKNRSLYKIIASQAEKDDLVSQEILPFSYRSRQIAIVTARSMFRQFGSRVIVNGRRVRDDYWETKARKQGFTEQDLAGEKRPGAARAREAAAAAEAGLTGPPMMGTPSGELVYGNVTGAFGSAGPALQAGKYGNRPGMPTTAMVPGTADMSDSRARDYSALLKAPRQEITGPPYQDRTQPSSITEINAQAHNAVDFNRQVNQQRDIRGDYLQQQWRRPHEQPAQPSGVPETSRAPSHTTAAAMQPGMVGGQSQQMMMTAPPYSSSIHAQNPVGGPMRGMAQPPSSSHFHHRHPQTQATARPTGLSSPGNPASAPSYSYSASAGPLWSNPPPTQQHGYSSYTTQAQPPTHAQSPAGPPQMRHAAGGPQVQPGAMQYTGMPALPQAYGTTSQSLYPTDQTPRQYMPQGSAPAPTVSQGWSNQQTPAWWASQPQ